MRTITIFLLTALTLHSSGCRSSQNAQSPDGIPAAGQTNVVDFRDIGSKVVIHGQLGLPIGTTITISGYVEIPSRSVFKVDEINGSKSSNRIMIEGIDKWPKGTKAVLEGHEYGRICLLEFLPHNLTLGAPALKNQELQTYFQITRIVERIDM